MKNQKITLTGFLLLTVITFMTFGSNNTFAQKNEAAVKEYSLSDNAVKSLIQGIKSENKGLKKNAIFLAGEYKLEETVDYLIEELQEEKDTETINLIVSSLNKIGNPTALDYLKDIVQNKQNKM